MLGPVAGREHYTGITLYSIVVSACFRLMELDAALCEGTMMVVGILGIPQNEGYNSSAVP